MEYARLETLEELFLRHYVDAQWELKYNVECWIERDVKYVLVNGYKPSVVKISAEKVAQIATGRKLSSVPKHGSIPEGMLNFMFVVHIMDQTGKAFQCMMWICHVQRMLFLAKDNI